MQLAAGRLPRTGPLIERAEPHGHVRALITYNPQDLVRTIENPFGPLNSSGYDLKARRFSCCAQFMEP